MKKILVVMAVLCACVASAHAISRYDSIKLSCARIQAIIKAEGAAIMRNRSPRNPSLLLYDRYVAGDRYCGAEEYAIPATIPSADKSSCRVMRCIEFSVSDR